ncbi:MAG: hypothetical protein OEZ01_14295 [Candidatus Heimdallarchaeota archaeon]|nr:hypothetical protein [Candidatus Heimdallarchaeota archaeon]MDH5647178.1 hypothetical protein [Candidatus Heimdallarchaeota archaeon]
MNSQDGESDDVDVLPISNVVALLIYISGISIFLKMRKNVKK